MTKKFLFFIFLNLNFYANGFIQESWQKLKNDDETRSFTLGLVNGILQQNDVLPRGFAHHENTLKKVAIVSMWGNIIFPLERNKFNRAFYTFLGSLTSDFIHSLYK